MPFFILGLGMIFEGSKLSTKNHEPESYVQIKYNQPNFPVSNKVLGEKSKVAFDFLGTNSGENFVNPHE